MATRNRIRSFLGIGTVIFLGCAGAPEPTTRTNNPTGPVQTVASTPSEAPTPTAPAARAAPPPPKADTTVPPRAVLFANPDRSAVKISPDGKKLSFLAPVDGVANVW